jgi:hypothetical protein
MFGIFLKICLLSIVMFPLSIVVAMVTDYEENVILKSIHIIALGLLVIFFALMILGFIGTIMLIPI